MTDHSNFLSNKVQFLLDATLGMVSIDQNNVIKIFSVVTVFMLPPSFIAGFFGMNFERLPLLHEPGGVTIAVILMVLSAALPYIYFKRRRWL
jgi:magnesium transporter